MSRSSYWLVRVSLVAAGGVVMLTSGCTLLPGPPPAPPQRPVRAQPPDWFHQQLAAAAAAKRAHEPKTDTAGAQQAYDDIMRKACTQAALQGPDQYPKRCQAILHPAPAQSTTDVLACDDDGDPSTQTACSD